MLNILVFIVKTVFIAAVALACYCFAVQYSLTAAKEYTKDLQKELLTGLSFEKEESE